MQTIGYSSFSNRRSLDVLLLTAVCFFLCFTGYPANAATEISGDGDDSNVNRTVDENPPFPDDGLLDGFDSTTTTSSGDDILLDGFDDDDTQNATGETDLPSSTSSAQELPVNLSGSASLAASYNFAHDPPEGDKNDWRGLSRLRTELFLELEIKPSDSWRAFISGKADYDFVYGIRGREDYTDEVLDDYEDELEFWEAYLQGNITKQIDLKIGRQIVVWGVSDNIRVVDVINPLDQREPGITDIEDLRLPVCMTKLDYYWKRFNISGIAIHEVRFNKNPAYGSDFYPLEVSVPEDIPESNLNNTQLAFSLSGIFSGWDVALYWADVYCTDTYLSGENHNASSVVRQKHARIEMAGSAGNIAIGNWLIKAELAWLDGLKFTNSPGKTYSRLDILAGVEYAGFSDTLVTFEIVNRHLFDHAKALENEPDQYEQDHVQWVVRLEREFLHENLTLTILASVYGETGSGGAFERFSAEYDITDSLKITGGLTLYQSGDLPIFRDIEDNDRFFLEFKYSF